MKWELPDVSTVRPAAWPESADDESFTSTNGIGQQVRRRLRLLSVTIAIIIAILILQQFFPWLRTSLDVGSQLGPMLLVLVFGLALVCEYVDSSLGMGYGTTLTPLLLLIGFEPLQIVPCVLLSEFITGLAAGIMHHRDGNVNFMRDHQARNSVIWLSILSVIGAVAAVKLALSIPKIWLNLIIAIMIISIGVIILSTIRRQLRYRRGHIIALGAVAAFNKALSGGGYGPLVTSGQVVSGLPAKHAIAATSLAESWTCLVGLIAYFLLHGRMDFTLAVPLTLGAMLSVPLATITVKGLPETWMRGTVGVATCTLGALALIKIIV